MKLYTGEKIEDLKEVRLIDVLSKNLNSKTEFNVKVGAFNDGSGSWISLEKETEKELIDVSISFNIEGIEIDNIRAWKTPIKRVVVEDEQKQIL